MALAGGSEGQGCAQQPRVPPEFRRPGQKTRASGAASEPVQVMPCVMPPCVLESSVGRDTGWQAGQTKAWRGQGPCPGSRTPQALAWIPSSGQQR